MDHRRLDGSIAIGGTSSAIGHLKSSDQGVHTVVGPSQAPSSAVSPGDAAARAQDLLNLRQVRRRDEAISFAPTTVTGVEALVHGRRYFPRIVEDIDAARDHVHVLIYAFRPGSRASEILESMGAAVRRGVDVRVAVDAVGSGIDLGSRRLYQRMRELGVEVVANDGLAVIRGGMPGGRRLRLHVEDAFHFDHRKMMVIDGRVAYVGGTGIEDHFGDGRFTDLMCRVTGPVVAQMQLAFVVSWVKDGGSKPPRLEGLFPADALIDDDRGALEGLSATVLMNVPGTGHHPIREAIERSLDAALDRIDIVNPYISNRPVIRRLVAAADRGVAVRIIVPAEPRPALPMAAFRSWYPALMGAGARILVHPGMAHAKVYRIDERLLIGSCNLDDLSLYRNDELDIMFEGPAAPALAASIFDELAAASTPASITSGWAHRGWERIMARVSRIL